MGYENSGQDSEAAFNMALATLERLDTILQQIRSIDSNVGLPPTFRHKTKIKLIKQFFINSTPLLDPKIVKEYQDEVLSFRMGAKSIVKNANQRWEESFTEKEAQRLDEILIELQVNLRKYFMPKKRESLF